MALSLQFAFLAVFLRLQQGQGSKAYLSIPTCKLVLVCPGEQNECLARACLAGNQHLLRFMLPQLDIM